MNKALLYGGLLATGATAGIAAFIYGPDLLSPAQKYIEAIRYRTVTHPCDTCGGRGVIGATNDTYGAITYDCRDCRGDGVIVTKERRF